MYAHHSELDLPMQPGEHRGVAALIPWGDDLEIAGEAQPRRDRDVVEEFPAVLVAKIETDGPQSIGQVVAEGIPEVDNTEAVLRTARDKTRATDPNVIEPVRNRQLPRYERRTAGRATRQSVE